MHDDRGTDGQDDAEGTGVILKHNPMTLQQIETLCKAKAEELLERYFGNLVKEAAIEKPEEIGDYSRDLPRQIGKEYSAYLKSIWSEIAPEGSHSFEEIFDKQPLSDLMTDDDREAIESAYDEAIRQTLWERITKTNHKDVTFYKGLLKRYTKDLLTALRCDFIEDAAKVIGNCNGDKAKDYHPSPIDTSDINLPDEMEQLVEQLAHNVHENWALGRLNDGWTYGPERDDTLKKHPCLIEYDDLPESEKEYDRHTAIETLKLILKLGWKVEKR